jgi:2-polyprenyl-3-methyl-5-hydroxy-6-metoxy-1,4-benzoquinol methylase
MKEKYIIKKSSPEVWDNVWKRERNNQENKSWLKKVSNEILIKRIKFEILKRHGSLKNLKIIEIGAGSGAVSGVLAKEGAEVTVLDYSKNAIKTSKKFFEDNRLPAKFLLGDAFSLDKKLLSKFDVSFSLGTTEHYLGEDREKMIKIHSDVLNKSGLTFICVPNKYNFSYQFHKLLSEKFNHWIFGQEYPFSSFELKKISKKFCKKTFIIGGYLFKDPFLLSQRLRRILKIESKDSIKREFSTPLDKLFSPTICLVGIK